MTRMTPTGPIQQPEPTQPLGPAEPHQPAPATHPIEPTQSGAAPTAPGSLGTPVQAAEAHQYLQALRDWVAQRRADLDAVDAAALQLSSAEQTAITSDLGVALTFWKAIRDRLVLLETTFEGGRVGRQEAERLSTLIHGRLDSTQAQHLSLPTTGSLAVSLPEACRLLDALTRTLQARAALTPGVTEASQRLVLARAALERCRDQLPLVPAGADRDQAARRLEVAERRLTETVERARRGADVGGTVGPLEIDLATLERDLIVASAERARAARTRAQAELRRSELRAKADAVRALEVRAIASVDPAPSLAVPNVAALGPVPQAGAELTAYVERLERVARALDVAHERYAAALAERDEVAGLAGAVGAMAETLRATPEEAQDLADLRRRVDGALTEVPVRLPRAAALVAAYQAYVDALSRRKDHR